MTSYIDGQPSEDLVRLQYVLVRMTDQLFRYCREHDLTMTLVAGSALGAVRHGDFIPWDDDIDLGMLRADFDRFIELFRHEPVPGMVLHSWQTEPDYPYSFAKVRLDGTRIGETDFEGKQIHPGIFVDVFPFDEAPASPLLEKVQRYGIGLLNLFIERPAIEDPLGLFSSKRRAARWLARRLAPILPGPQRLAWMRDAILRMKGARPSALVDCLGMFGTNASNRTRIEATAIFPPVPGRLGPFDVLIPADSEAYLTRMYRDWRKLPPEDLRHPIHVTEVDFGDHPLAKD
jgi:lipopolysaccharide cholinephosphotransferase